MTDRPPDSLSKVRLVAVEGLLTRRFDDESVIFSPLSWDAHLLNPAAAAVLELLQEKPRSETEVIEFLAEVLRSEERPRAADHSKQLIRELLSLGLIQAHGN